jgi:hyperosmotically inducible periplasmic protein
MRYTIFLTASLLAACASTQQPAVQLQKPAPAAESPLVKNAEVTVDDGTVATNVRTALRTEPMLAGRQIDVRCQNGTVHLIGAVKSPDQRQRAEGLAREVEGVKDINNRIELEK